MLLPVTVFLICLIFHYLFSCYSKKNIYILLTCLFTGNKTVDVADREKVARWFPKEWKIKPGFAEDTSNHVRWEEHPFSTPPLHHLLSKDKISAKTTELQDSVTGNSTPHTWSVVLLLEFWWVCFSKILETLKCNLTNCNYLPSKLLV